MELGDMFDNLGQQIYNTLIANDRWTMFLDGLLVTLMIAGIAVLMGVVIGSVVAIAKVNALRNKRLKWLNVICDIYLTVIRGTPVLVQLLIMYYIIFAAAPIEMAPYVAALAFGINSGAYVAEIVRSGIMAVPRGQMEAGRSLGLTNGMTMRTIIFPQAIKNILPALGNEFIVLFKETSIVGYVAVTDLTRAAELVRSRTMDAFVPLIFIALVYLGIVMLITWALRKLEKKLARSDVR
ncbi:amino acid ABC transporter permease [Christensenella minuta]|uniref:Putative arginine ABC transporter, permease protein ArtQ n=2 Tax=Christensenella minuta TaxID=626937 RepID=A0A136Q5Y7_9FIRM|nr:amino acid ABC transporter permease [Christensenella minuta]KXK66081.1 putative arginine ABC transporter, permease protein ArtQ [Christensenella minuta]